MHPGNVRGRHPKTFTDDTVTAISIFNNVEAAEESNRRALAWIEQNIGPLLTGPVSAVAGPVIVHTLA
jgi:hypothetical protein